MIAIDQEQLIAIPEVPRRPDGKQVHISAVYRWVQQNAGFVSTPSQVRAIFFPHTDAHGQGAT